MAYKSIAAIEAIEGGSGSGLLPAGAYVAVITEAHITTTKKGEIALLVTWDVAEGEHVGHFGAAQFGHTEWLMLEGKGAPYAAHRLDVIGTSNSQPPVTFNARLIADQYAAQFDAAGRTGQVPVNEFSGRYVGFVIGTEDNAYNGNVSQRNYVAKWLTPGEVRSGKTLDGKPITIPAHRAAKAPAASAPAAQPAPMSEDPIPF